jgi:hypothetical protein
MSDNSLLLLLLLLLPLAAGNPDAKRLYDDLLSNYNRLIRPVANNTDKITVKMGLKLSQLVDLVSKKLDPVFLAFRKFPQKKCSKCIKMCHKYYKHVLVSGIAYYILVYQLLAIFSYIDEFFLAKLPKKRSTLLSRLWKAREISVWIGLDYRISLLGLHSL